MPYAAASFGMIDRLMVVPTDMACSHEASCSQATQADVTTATTGTQCPLIKVFSSTGAQTEKELPVLKGTDPQDSFERFPSSQEGVDDIARAAAKQEWNHTCTCHLQSSNGGELAKDHKGISLGGKHCFCQPYEQHSHLKNSSALHVREEVKTETFPCSVCHKKFSQRGILLHSRVHGGKPYKCRFCQRSFALKIALTRHEYSHTSKPHVCSFCGKRFVKKQVLDEHERLHAGEKPYVCNFCQKGFTQRSHLVNHQIMHTGERSHVCNVCQRSFALKSALNRHRRVHSSESPHVCNVCQRRFTQNRHLVTHQPVHTGTNGCTVATKSATTKVSARKGLLDAHQVTDERVRTGKRPHVCNVCQKSFTLKTTLDRHKWLHCGARPYVCTICQKRFTHGSHLVNHQRVHTGERPYACNLCPQSFAKKSTLDGHKRVHSGEKPYVCSVCQKRFTHKGHLVSHQKVHTGTKGNTVIKGAMFEASASKD